MSDLLKTVQENTEVDYSFIKITILAVTGVLISLALSYFLSAFYVAYGTQEFLLTLAAAGLYLVIFFLQTIFIKDIGRLLVIVFWQTLALLTFFIFSFDAYIAAGLLFAGLFFVWGAVSGQHELRASLKVKILRLSKFILPKADRKSVV